MNECRIGIGGVVGLAVSTVVGEVKDEGGCMENEGERDKLVVRKALMYVGCKCVNSAFLYSFSVCYA